MKILKNQVILRPAVLDYNGKPVVKKWDDIKRFIGKKVRVTIEHPSVDNLTNEFEKGAEVSTTVIKKCPRENALCADLPDYGKKGYSVGYGYSAVKEKGTLRGKAYNWWRKLKNINHIALVSHPRDPTLIKVAGDSLSPCTATDGICYVNIYPKISIGVDSFVFKDDDLMAEEIEKLTAELEKARQLAKDSAERAELYKKQNLGLLSEKVAVAIDSLETNYGFEKKTWEGKTPDFIEGALYALNIKKAQDAMGSGIEHLGQVDDNEISIDGYYDINDVVLDSNGHLALPK